MMRLRHFVHQLWQHAGRWFTSAGILIALVWLVPPILGHYWPEGVIHFDWISQGLLTAVTAAAAILVGSYRTWLDAATEAEQLRLAASAEIPVVRLAERGSFNGGYSDAPMRPLPTITFAITEVRNPSARQIYLNTPTVNAWAFSPDIFAGPGRVTLLGKVDRRLEPLDRASIPPRDSRFDLEVKVEASFIITSREQLASILKHLDAGVTLEFHFTPEIDEPVLLGADIEFESFRAQVLNWWEQEGWNKLIRIYADS